MENKDYDIYEMTAHSIIRIYDENVEQAIKHMRIMIQILYDNPIFIQARATDVIQNAQRVLLILQRLYGVEQHRADRFVDDGSLKVVDDDSDL